MIISVPITLTAHCHTQVTHQLTNMATLLHTVPTPTPGGVLAVALANTTDAERERLATLTEFPQIAGASFKDWDRFGESIVRDVPESHRLAARALSHFVANHGSHFYLVVRNLEPLPLSRVGTGSIAETVTTLAAALSKDLDVALSQHGVAESALLALLRPTVDSTIPASYDALRKYRLLPADLDVKADSDFTVQLKGYGMSSPDILAIVALEYTAKTVPPVPGAPQPTAATTTATAATVPTCGTTASGVPTKIVQIAWIVSAAYAAEMISNTPELYHLAVAPVPNPLLLARVGNVFANPEWPDVLHCVVCIPCSRGS